MARNTLRSLSHHSQSSRKVLALRTDVIAVRRKCSRGLLIFTDESRRTCMPSVRSPRMILGISERRTIRNHFPACRIHQKLPHLFLSFPSPAWKQP